MAQTKYDLLPATEQIAMLRTRIAGLQRDHYAVTLDVKTAGRAGNSAQEQRAAELDEIIADLQNDLAALEAEAR